MLHISTEQLDKAVKALKAGKVIVYPTETSYALGCDATNDKAVRRIFDIKGRPGAKGLPVVIAGKEEAYRYVEISETAQALMDQFWPGALNVIAPIAFGSPIAASCAQHGTQSLRVSSHPFVAALASRFGKPIVATSANISGQDQIYSVDAVEEVFAGRPQPDVVIDAGVLNKVPSSTTVKVIGNEVTVIREGEITLPEQFL